MSVEDIIRRIYVYKFTMIDEQESDRDLQEVSYILPHRVT